MLKNLSRDKSPRPAPQGEGGEKKKGPLLTSLYRLCGESNRSCREEDVFTDAKDEQHKDSSLEFSAASTYGGRRSVTADSLQYHRRLLESLARLSRCTYVVVNRGRTTQK